MLCQRANLMTEHRRKLALLLADDFCLFIFTDSHNCTGAAVLRPEVLYKPFTLLFNWLYKFYPHMLHQLKINAITDDLLNGVPI